MGRRRKITQEAKGNLFQDTGQGVLSASQIQEIQDGTKHLLEQMKDGLPKFYAMIVEIIDQTLSYIDKLDAPFSDEKLKVLRHLHLLREGAKEQARILKTYSGEKEAQHG